jgi:hypothetical protein
MATPAVPLLHSVDRFPSHGERSVVDNPEIVIEMLSPRAKQADPAPKRGAYRAIGAMQAILSVAADAFRAELSPVPA